MTFLLDTNICIGLFRGDTRIQAAVSSRNPDDLYVCTPVVAELYVGAYKSERRRANIVLIEELLRTYDCLAFSTRESLKFAELVTRMKAVGKTGTVFDLQIAATALAHGMMVVTNDVDFQNVPDISLVDWTR